MYRFYTSQASVGLILSGACLVVPGVALASDTPLDQANTAWIMTATALVLLMTLPGLALFYGGLVQAKNVLSVFTQCFAIACLMSLLWLAGGYSLAFGDGGALDFLIGGLGKAFLFGIGTDTLAGDIPEVLFFMFQMTFAIITPALIVGASPERMRFSSLLIFSALWLVLVYAPVCHWVWGGGWLAELGVMDFAGGLVVHATAGTAALVLVRALGNRDGFPGHLQPPHNPGLTMMGAAFLWVGWFGFNGGSALAAGGGAAMAMLVTHLSASTAALVWVIIEWRRFGRPSLVGIVTGAIAGLAAVTPASGYVGPLGGVIIGAASGFLCWRAVGWIKHKWRIDDSLDVFAVHGVGGILGVMLVAPLALPWFGGAGLGGDTTVARQLAVQGVGVAATVIWTAGATWLICKLAGALTGGLRVSKEDMTEGLDLSCHGERGYNIKAG